MNFRLGVGLNFKECRIWGWIIELACFLKNSNNPSRFQASEWGKIGATGGKTDGVEFAIRKENKRGDEIMNKYIYISPITSTPVYWISSML